MNAEHRIAAWRRQIEETLHPRSPGSAVPGLTKLVADLHQRDGVERRRAAARLRGYLRRCDAEARLDLTGMLLRELAITATQHGARIVMQEVFGIGASTAALTERFAAPARNASVKYAPAARKAIERADPALLDAARRARAWAQRELHRRITELKTRRAAPAQGVLSCQGRPAST